MGLLSKICGHCGRLASDKKKITQTNANGVAFDVVFFTLLDYTSALFFFLIEICVFVLCCLRATFFIPLATDEWSR